MTLSRGQAIASAAGLFALVAGGATSQRSGAEGLASIKVGTLTIDPAMQPLYAQDQGFFAAEGLDPNIIILNNSNTAVSALVTGTIDIASASSPMVAFAHERGIPIRFIAAAGIYTGPVGNTIMMVPKNSTMKSGADLAGKTVGVSELHDMTQFEASTWIDKTGGDSKSARFVELKYAEMPAALEQGRVDAAVLIEPFISAAKTSSKTLGNLSDTMGGPYVVSGWVSSDDYIRRNPDLIRRYVNVMQKAAAWANNHQRESADILVRYTKIRPDVAATMNRIHYYEGATIDPITLQRPIDMMVKYGALTPLSAKDIIAAR